MSNELFLARWRDAVKARSDERASEKLAQSSVTDDAVDDSSRPGAPSTLNPGVHLIRPSASKNPELFAPDTRDYWDSYAGQLVRQYVKLIGEPSSASGVAKEVLDSVLAPDYKGEPGKSLILITLEVDNLFESTVRPWDRKAPPNQAVIGKLLQGVLTARGGVANEDGLRIAPGDEDVVVLCDGGRENLKSVLSVPRLALSEIVSSVPEVWGVVVNVAPLRLAQFTEKKTMPAAHLRELIVGLNEDSARERKQRMRSNQPIQLTHRALLISNKSIDGMIPDKKYTTFSGSTRGNLLTLLHMPSYESMWQLPVDQKVAIYNHKDGSRLVSPGAVDASAEKPAPTGDEVVFFGSLPQAFWVEVLSSYCARGVLDCSAGSGEVCKAALTLRKPCVSFTLSDAHKALLMDHLVGWMLEAMCDRKGTFYNQAYDTWKSKPATKSERSGPRTSLGGGQASGTLLPPKETPTKRGQLDDNTDKKAKNDNKKRKHETKSDKKRKRSSSSSASTSSDSDD